MSGRPWFSYVKANKLPTPGAMEYALETELMAFRPMVGPGIGCRQQFYSILPGPMSYQAGTMAWAGGLNGIVQGQVGLQPLSNPYD